MENARHRGATRRGRRGGQGQGCGAGSTARSAPITRSSSPAAPAPSRIPRTSPSAASRTAARGGDGGPPCSLGPEAPSGAEAGPESSSAGSSASSRCASVASSSARAPAPAARAPRRAAQPLDPRRRGRAQQNSFQKKFLKDRRVSLQRRECLFRGKRLFRGGLAWRESQDQAHALEPLPGSSSSVWEKEAAGSAAAAAARSVASLRADCERRVDTQMAPMA